MKCIGILALQGGVAEHVSHLEELGAKVVEVRLPEDMAGIEGLVLPGGESSAIAHLITTAGLMDPLKAWVAEGKPTWGTCAGMILLSDKIANPKRGGQATIGGLHVCVKRNFFGSQLGSFVSTLTFPEPLSAHAEGEYRGVFIRAPAIVSHDQDVTVLARVVQKKTSISALQDGVSEVIVAAKQGNHILCTSFHPELTSDLRWARYFLSMVPEK